MDNPEGIQPLDRMDIQPANISWMDTQVYNWAGSASIPEALISYRYRIVLVILQGSISNRFDIDF
jgi:hypothetical protein